MTAPIVAILGTRYQDFGIEEAALGPLGATLVSGPGDSPAAIASVAGDADVILAGSAPKFTADVITGLRCRGIVRYGVGTDSVDLDAARANGIAVARVSDYGTEAVAFHAVASACALVRRLPDADRAIRSGGWGVAHVRPLHLPSTLTAGIVGYGRIGRQAAHYLLSLGFTVCAYDEYVDIPAGDGVRALPLDDLLETSDIVLLHVPGNPDGSPLLDARRLRLMRPGSVLVNTARGSLVDIPALVAGLKAGRPGLAALDVFPHEPTSMAPFEGVEERVLLTPHLAWYTEESETDLRRKAAAEAGRLLSGEPLRDPVVVPDDGPEGTPP